MSFILYELGTLPTVSVLLEDETTNAPSGGGSLSFPWQIILIVVGGILLAALIAFLVITVIRLQRERGPRERTNTRPNAKPQKTSKQSVPRTIARREIASPYYIEVTETQSGRQYTAYIEENKPVVFGRNSGAIQVSSPYISQEHCQVRLKGELMYVQDLSSKNGTYYNGARIFDEIPIMSGSKLRLGQTEITIRLFHTN